MAIKKAPIPKTAEPAQDSFDPSVTHREYTKNSKKWEQLRVCLEGEEAIKEAGELYLPYPVRVDDADKTTDTYLDLYTLYLQGAHFVEYTAEAVEDLVSSAFRRPIEMEPELPKDLEYLDITDLAKETVSCVGAYGRSFLFVDYPTLSTTPSMAEDGDNKAYLNIYEPLDVLDWTETRRSGKSELIRVVLREIDEVREAQKMDLSSQYMYRVLYVENKTFKMDVYREGEAKQTYTPKAAGKAFTEIPGLFVGTTSNTVKVDKSPVIGISNSNLKHYQTWADLMHVQVYSGNPQLVLAGLAAGWNKAAKKNEVKVKLDAANILALEGDNSSASLLEIDTGNLIHFRTLEVLEQSMSEQGAKIKSISKKAGVESAEALKIRSSASMSKLAAIVANTEEALNRCLVWAGQYMSTTVTTKVSINKEFFSPQLDGGLLSSISAAEAANTAPRGTTVEYLKQIELVDDAKTTDEYIKAMGPIVQEETEVKPENKPKEEKTPSGNPK